MTYDPAEFHRKRNERAKRSVLEGERAEKCAVCDEAATGWSGVEEWRVDGAWIGWCSTECRNRWLNGEKLA